MISYRPNKQEELPLKRRNPSTIDSLVIMWLTLESYLITALVNMIRICFNGLYGPIMFVSMVALIRVTLIDHDRLLCISMAWASPLSYSKSRARCLTCRDTR